MSEETLMHLPAANQSLHEVEFPGDFVQALLGTKLSSCIMPDQNRHLQLFFYFRNSYFLL
jgi:hypothetical protein